MRIRHHIAIYETIREGKKNRVFHNRRALTNRQCSRCSSRQAPAWYGALQCVSREHYRAHPILNIVVRHLACSSVYKIPWHLTREQELRMGRVALFIGELHCRKFKFPGSAWKEEYSPEAWSCRIMQRIGSYFAHAAAFGQHMLEGIHLWTWQCMFFTAPPLFALSAWQGVCSS